MDLNLEDFLYDLPEDRIAKHPPKNRQDSRLLFYNRGAISHHQFQEVSQLIPENTLLVFNDTRVIPARIIMHKESGARIELFLLEPLSPSKVHEEVMNATNSCSWKCMIGNAKKWKVNTSLHHETIGMKATRTAQDVVTFEWSSSLTFSDLLTEIGKIPLPPYINREVEEIDQERYQTVYSKTKGAVAAARAGLHFTEEVLADIKKRDIQTDFLTLHVSAGTFQPIKTDNIAQHPMHNEQVWITKENVQNLLAANNIIAVGTTSVRTMESLYWFGVKLMEGIKTFDIKKEDAYQFAPKSKEEALTAVLSFMEEHNIFRLSGQTEIFIYPGYVFRICDGLITNYHLPGSTLVLLIAAFIGDDWKEVYSEALKQQYRFLSYGDSSLLIPKNA